MALNMMSAVNENTLALANLKFDFSLLKVEAPEEYSAFGQSLSRNRRNDAEDGRHHRTARRLGALFEQLIPSTPKLIKAYGKRACEILETGGVNPRGSPKDGAFEAFVGADGTAMWAAATSGISSLGVYLLACLLARAWEAREAVSIWVELVEGRRNEILRGIENHCNVSEASRMGIFQEISRKDLAEWDASARAWLQSADKARLADHVQFMLIFNNIQLPFSSGSSTYRQVVDSWQHSMEALERLLCGEPQEISNRTILLAFSAWHIYPDLVVLGEKITKVAFGDQHVSTGGIGTIAREPRLSNKNGGSSWSLSLSHLRYYGDPIIAETDLDFTRVGIEQLHLVALGCLLNHWKIAQRDIPQACKWFQGVWCYLQAQPSSSHVLRLKNERQWFRLISEAAKKLITDHAVYETVAGQLLNFGRRRGRNFLTCCDNCIKPFFGLINPPLLNALASPLKEEVDLVFLREIAKYQGLYTNEAFIRYQRKTDTYTVEELITAVPHVHKTEQLDAEKNLVIESLHGRWIYFKPSSFHTRSNKVTNTGLEVHRRVKDIQSRGEKVVTVVSSPVAESKGNWIWLTPPPIFGLRKNSEHGTIKVKDEKSHLQSDQHDRVNPCRCFEIDYLEDTSDTYESPIFWSMRKVGNYELFVKSDASYRNGSQVQDTPWKIPDMSPAAALDICSKRIKPDVLAQYLIYSTNPCLLKPENIAGPESLLKQPTKRKRSDMDGCRHISVSNSTFDIQGLSQDFITRGNLPASNSAFDAKGLSQGFINCRSALDSMLALAFISELYLSLHGATISLKIVSKLLALVTWIPKHTCSSRQSLEPNYEKCEFISPLKRTVILACIVHLETGGQELHPEDFEETLAIASGNSLFVVGSLLADPLDAEAGRSVKRITGNIGKPGLSLLVAPVHPKIRPMNQEYNLVIHHPYNGQRENKFQSTSLHLSFTEWTMPIEARSAGTGLIDQDIHIVESVVSLFECGKWVADLDILSIDFNNLFRFKAQGPCLEHSNETHPCDYVSIDNWEELIDRPYEVAFFRAHGNWAARLAAVSILCQKGQSHAIGLLGPENFCLACLEKNHGFNRIENYQSQLPSICID